MEQRELTCINCPLGCQLTVTIERGEAAAVTGNGCPRGAQYARDEIRHPVRMVTSTVPVQSGELARVSVKTSAPVPKDRILAVMADIHRLTAVAPVRSGQILCPDLAGTGVSLVATKTVAAR